MITRFFKDYNKLFAAELNKSATVREFIGEVHPTDIHILHNVIQYTWVRLLYEYFPTVLNFGKYFYVFTKHQKILDQFEINNYHKMKRENKTKKSRNTLETRKKWSDHINRVN